MKKIIFVLVAFATALNFSSCDQLNLGLSQADIVKGLKEALRVSSDTSVVQTNKLDGFNANSLIHIHLPPEAVPVVTVVSVLPGGQALLDALELKLNRAAEQASIKALPIFENAISTITFDDAKSILKGSDTAATHYLNTKTFSDLYTAFKPDIQDALTAVGAQQSWTDVINLYNTVPFVTPVNADLADHTTNKALDGLFMLIGSEEKNIRNDASHQVNDILKQTFGK